MGEIARRVSVVICAYTEDRWGQLTAAVASLAEQTVPPSETIIVIDHNPSLLERARSAFSQAVVVTNGEARGLSGARNCGVAAAQGDVVAFLDDDAVAAPDWVERLCAGFDDQCVIGTGGSISPSWSSGRPAWFPEEFDWVVGCTYRGMPLDASPVRNLIGANMSFRREILAELGGFRSGMGRVGTFPAGCEETELCIRAQQHRPGSILLYNPAARVKHQVTSGRASLAYFRSRCYAEGMSKALVSQSVGAGDALSAERAHALGALPRGVLRGIVDSAHGDLAGLARAAVIVAGFVITATGYLVGFAAGRLRPVFSGYRTMVSSRLP